MRRLVGCLLAVLCSLMAAVAQPFEPRELAKSVAGPLTEVAVLGTDHLLNLPTPIRPEHVEPVLERLQRFRPDIILVEAVSGLACELVYLHTEIFGSQGGVYCDTDAAKQATGLTAAKAVLSAERTLATWPSAPSAAERRKLASTFLAANEMHSALVQWLRLPEAERKVGDGLDLALVQHLHSWQISREEGVLIGVNLAVRLGLERVYPMDDHTAGRITASPSPERAAWGKEFLSAGGVEARLRARLIESYKGYTSAEGVLQGFRYNNGPRILADYIIPHFANLLADSSPQRFGRIHVAWWETRNMRMAANIRAAFGPSAGARVLVIVGSSHKPFLDAYFAQMLDVRVVDTLALLN